VAALNVRELGDFIRDQRRTAQISLRQLAQQAGVSNPYLSQIERGLRKPSAEILQQIAKALRISAEVLYVQAGILEEREGGEDVHAAVLADEFLTARQKQVILDIYDAFRRENAVAGADGVLETLSPIGEPAGVATGAPAAPSTSTSGTSTSGADADATSPAAQAAAEPTKTPVSAKPGRTAATGRPRRAASDGAASDGAAASTSRITTRRPRVASAEGTAEARPARRATTRRTTTRHSTAVDTTDDGAAAPAGPAGGGEPSGSGGSPATAAQP